MIVGSEARPSEITGFDCTPLVFLSPTQAAALVPENGLAQAIWYLGDWIGMVWAIWITVQALGALAPDRRIQGAIGFAITLLLMMALALTR